MKVTKPVPKITGLKPTGSRFLVEMLTTQEAMNTKVFVTDNVKVPVHQAYVLAIGPNIPENFGVEVGSRVWIDGGIVYAPDFDDHPRKRGTIEYHMVKGVIAESPE